MSRSNPNKRKPRYARKMRLIVGEGQTEKAFCKYLKSCFSCQENNISITPDCSGGGGSNGVIERAQRVTRNRAYSRCLILLDTDDADVVCPKIPKHFGKAVVFSIRMQPCIEGFFLNILDDFRPSWNSDRCKKRFHENYLDENEKLEPPNYKRIFPKELLEEKRSEIEELDLLLKCYEI